MLEEILREYFNLPYIYYTQGEWNIAYGKLTKLIYDLSQLGIIDYNEVITQLDEINSKEE